MINLPVCKNNHTRAAILNVAMAAIAVVVATVRTLVTVVIMLAVPSKEIKTTMMKEIRQLVTKESIMVVQEEESVAKVVVVKNTTRRAAAAHINNMMISQLEQVVNREDSQRRNAKAVTIDHLRKKGASPKVLLVETKRVMVQ